MKQRKILIVDDEASILKYFKKWLEFAKLGIIETESSGIKAMERNKIEKYDLILLDMQLHEEIEGLELLKMILADNPECYIIIVTAFPETYRELEAMRLGAKDYLIKVVEEEMLIRTVKRGIEYLEQKEEIKRLAEEKKKAEIKRARLEEQKKAAEERIENLKLMVQNFAHRAGKSLCVITTRVTELIQKGVFKEESESIKNQARMINQIIDGLLDYCGEKSPSPERVSIKQILEETVAFINFRDHDRLKDITLKIDYRDNPDIKADITQIKSVFGELIENAISSITKKEDKKGNISIGVIKDGKYVKVSVKDDGIGISDEDRARVFDPFFTSTPGGRGLGLSICYGFIENHQGKIEPKSEGEMKGAEFIVYLPLPKGVKENA